MSLTNILKIINALNAQLQIVYNVVTQQSAQYFIYFHILIKYKEMQFRILS